MFQASQFLIEIAKNVLILLSLPKEMRTNSHKACVFYCQTILSPSNYWLLLPMLKKTDLGGKATEISYSYKCETTGSL